MPGLLRTLMAVLMLTRVKNIDGGVDVYKGTEDWYLFFSDKVVRRPSSDRVYTYYWFVWVET